MVSTTISLDNKTPSSKSEISTSRSNNIVASTSLSFSTTTTTITTTTPSSSLSSSSAATTYVNNTQRHYYYHQQQQQQQQQPHTSNKKTTSYDIGLNGGASSGAGINHNSTVKKFDSSSSLNEKISILFPKCRPKNDVNHQAPMNTSPKTKINNNNNNPDKIMSSPVTSSLSSPDTNSIAATMINTTTNNSVAVVKSPNISTNPFLSRHPTEKISYYYKNRDDYSNSQLIIGGGGGVGASISASGGISGSNNDFKPNSAVPTYTQKLLTQKHHLQQQQQQQQQQQPIVYHPNQNPFINSKTDSQWELSASRSRHTGGSGGSGGLSGGGGGGGGSGGGRETPNVTPASTVLNSPDLIEAMIESSPRLGNNKDDYSYGSQHHHHHYIRVGRSPVSSGGAGNIGGSSGSGGNSNNTINANIKNNNSTQLSKQTTPTTVTTITNSSNKTTSSNNSDAQLVISPTKNNMAVVADGEVVVFDDIGENWQNLRITDASPPPKSVNSSLNSFDKKRQLSQQSIHQLLQDYVGMQDHSSTSSSYQHHNRQQHQQSQQQQNYNDYHHPQQPREGNNSPTDVSKHIRPKNLTTSSLSTTTSAADNNKLHHISSTVADNDNLERSYSNTSETRITSNGDSLMNISGIMEYDGSPRRFGQIQNSDSSSFLYSQSISNVAGTNNSTSNKASSSLFTAPRPGFPQRVITTTPTADATTAPTMSETPSIAQMNTDDTSNDVSDIVTFAEMSFPTDQQPSTLTSTPRNSTFDYLYEFSETRKVLEEFFKCPGNEEKMLENGSDVDSIDIHYEFKGSHDKDFAKYVGQRLASSPFDEYPDVVNSPKKNGSSLFINNASNGIGGGNGSNGNNGHINKHSLTGELSEPIKDVDYFLDSASRSSGEVLDNDLRHVNRSDSRCYRYSPETTDYDSNCGDLDSLSGDFNINNSSYQTNYSKYYVSMPILEDGLSSGHASDTENNNPMPTGGISLVMDMRQQQLHQKNEFDGLRDRGRDTICSTPDDLNTGMSAITTIALSMTPTTTAMATTSSPPPPPPSSMMSNGDNNRYHHNHNHNHNHHHYQSHHHNQQIDELNNSSSLLMMRSNGGGDGAGTLITGNGLMNSNSSFKDELISEDELRELNRMHIESRENILNSPKNKIFKNIDPELDSLYSISMVQLTPPPPAPAPHRKPSIISCSSPDMASSHTTINKNNLDRTKLLGGNKSTTEGSASGAATTTPPIPPSSLSMNCNIGGDDKQRSTSSIMADNNSATICSPVWIPRNYENTESLESEPVLKSGSGDEEEVDTDLETDRLLGHQRLEDHEFYDEKNWCDRKTTRSLLSKFSPKVQPNNSGSIIRQGLNALLPITPETTTTTLTSSATVATVSQSQPSTTTTVTTSSVSTTRKLLDIGGSISSPDHSEKSPMSNMEMPTNDESPTGGGSSDKDVEKKKKSKNKEGVLFRARYLGSTQLICEGQPTKSTRMVQAEEAVSRIKAPDGEVQPSTEVDLFISTEKIMVLNTDLKEIMMDHALRTISYIADIGDLVVLMARRRFVPNEIDDPPTTKSNRTPKMICHVFESEEAQFIAQSIGQAFQVAYMEFLKANGIEDHSFVKEMDYQEVLNSQEIFGDELEIFAKKELQKEVVVPKAKGEILGVVIVESGWGSMLPTVVIANLLSSGAAARCGQLNIGDQIIAINGMSLVGLPLSTCQNYIKNTKTQTVVKFTVVPCAPVVEVKIKRPNTKYQLGFSVQNGVICSLLRGGIAERGGVRVGHRIIEINNQSVVAVPHEKIVNLLATSVGEILMKTMPTSMFRLLTGQENPIYI